MERRQENGQLAETEDREIKWLRQNNKRTGREVKLNYFCLVFSSRGVIPDTGKASDILGLSSEREREMVGGRADKIVNMLLNVHRNRTAYYGRGEGGGGVWRWGEREIIYLSLHCHHQNDFCIKMGSDESHFNVSVGSDGQSHKTVSTNYNLFEEKREPKRYRTDNPFHRPRPRIFRAEKTTQTPAKLTGILRASLHRRN